MFFNNTWEGHGIQRKSKRYFSSAARMTVYAHEKTCLFKPFLKMIVAPGNILYIFNVRNIWIMK